MIEPMPSMRERIDAGEPGAVHGADAGAHRRRPDDRGGERVRRRLRRPRAHRHLARDHVVALLRRRSARASRRWCGCPRTTTSTSPGALDIGAMGVIVPHVETPERGGADRRRRAASRLAVTGRSPAPTRRTATSACRQRELLDAFDAQTVVAAMVETPDAIAQADEIAVGPRARHGAAGPARPHRGDGDPRPVPRRDASSTRCARSRRRVATHGKIFGIAGISDLDLLTELVGLGLRFVSAGTDAGFMTEAATAHAARAAHDSCGEG